MAQLVYILCAVTSVACAVLLFRGYRESRTGLLFWSSVGFAGLALNNVLLYVDLVILADGPDLSLLRSGTALASLGVLMYGLIGETK